MTLFFTADQHYGHANIIIYTNRPFASVEEMDEELIRRHNEVVGPNDTVTHAGDFTLAPDHIAQRYLRRLNGKHNFIMGSHDRWLENRYSSPAPYMVQMQLGKVALTVCHYAMRTWHKSHYNAWQLYGHSHGKLEPIGKQWDIGVDNNNFYPVSFEQLREIMASRPDNPNLVKRGR